MFRGPWWAQDGAPAHRLLQVRDRLNEVFGNDRVIGLGHNVEWPARSPDLTPCDFFMWGYLKDKVYSTDDVMPCESSLLSLDGQCKICTGEQGFVLPEMVAMSKAKGLEM